MRPLDRIPSIKLKLGIVIVAAILAGMGMFVLTRKTGPTGWPSIPVAIVVALTMVQLLAHGMTSPLREMSVAARAMARGEYGRRVTASSADEVGELARAFNAMTAELAETDQLRRDLVANVSHELRTPLAALRAGLENLVDGVEPAEPAALQLMLDQVERLGRMVTQLLDLSRLESGTVRLEREMFSLGPVLESVAATARLHRSEADIRVRTSELAPVVHGDPERVHQVITNLLDNALRHAPKGTAVEVSAEQRRPGQPVTITVSDQGPGIPDEESERVFERFLRLDEARASDLGGAGLGLAIVRWIVELHGGTIRTEPMRRTGSPRGCRMVVTLLGGRLPA